MRSKSKNTTPRKGGKVAPAIDPAKLGLAAALYQLDRVTETEARIVECLREWRRAETDSTLYHELNSWDYMRHMVRRYRINKFTMEDAHKMLQGTPEDAAMLYIAVKTIAGLLPLFSSEEK